MPPFIVDGSVALAPTRLRAGQAFTISFQASEALENLPEVTLALVPPPPVPCEETAALTYACTYTASGQEHSGLGGDVGVNVHLRDLAGNDSFQSNVRTVTFDFVPPSPTVASVVYLPAPSNLLPSVARATGGTAVRVSVSADEKLSASAVPSLVARLGSAQLSFAVVPGGLGDNDVLFATTIAATDPDGAYTLAVTWSDEVGNVGTSVVAGTLVEVKTSPPSLVVDQNALVFVRSPMGSSADEVLGSYTILAGPYFAVEPSDVFTTAATLPPGSLLLADGTLPTEVIVQSDATARALIVGVLRPSGAAFPRQKLATPDFVTVWLVGVDDAGNASAPKKLQNAEWVATPNPTAVGTNPNALEWTGYASTTRSQAVAVVTPDPVSLSSASGADGQAILVRAAAAWREQTPPATLPSARDFHGMAYDGARCRNLLFGGSC
jgi:hypothetical protein